MDIDIRPLQESDALTSYEWRNDPTVWSMTGAKFDRHITKEIEQEWIKRVLQDGSAKRFAICIDETKEYIGNVQLTDITNIEAELHIFIGEKKYWGQGIATKVISKILDDAFNELKLKSVYLEVKSENAAAIKAYEKNGFKAVSKGKPLIRMEIHETTK